MRYWFGLMCVLALAVMGCSETPDGTDLCEGVMCEDDGNECTHEYCDGGTCRRTTYDEGQWCDDGDDNECLYGACYGGACSSDIGDYQSPYWVDDLTPCESGGVSGVCVYGECVEHKCQTDGDCDDGDPCTEGTCQNLSIPPFECSYRPANDCSYCDLKGASGRCLSGVCVEDLCEGVVCNDGDPCTSDWCRCPSWECNFSFCSHGNQCTDTFCNPGVGCSYPPANEGMYCGCGAWMPEACPPFTFSCGYTCVAHKYCRNGECV